MPAFPGAWNEVWNCWVLGKWSYRISLSGDSVTGSLRSLPHVPTHQVLITTLWDEDDDYPHVAHEETEAQRPTVTK